MICDDVSNVKRGLLRGKGIVSGMILISLFAILLTTVPLRLGMKHGMFDHHIVSCVEHRKMVKLIGLGSLFLLIASQLNGQQAPLVLHPTIGDTVDAGERQRFHILPSLEAFEWAVFYLNPDSTLKVKVHRSLRGVECDTTIPGYRTLASMRYQIRYIIEGLEVGSDGERGKSDCIDFWYLGREFSCREIYF